MIFIAGFFSGIVFWLLLSWILLRYETRKNRRLNLKEDADS